MWRSLLAYLSALLPTVEQRTSMATSGTVTTTSVWHVWHTTTWWTRWRSAPPTRSCCCLPVMTLPLRYGARHAWYACHRPLPGLRGPAGSCRPGWAATRTQHLPAVSMENHEPGWKTSLIFFHIYIYTHTLHVHVLCGYSQWFCLSSQCCAQLSGDGLWCDLGLDTRERQWTRTEITTDWYANDMSEMNSQNEIV